MSWASRQAYNGRVTNGGTLQEFPQGGRATSGHFKDLGANSRRSSGGLPMCCFVMNGGTLVEFRQGGRRTRGQFSSLAPISYEGCKQTYRFFIEFRRGSAHVSGTAEC
jgi:hypothetical protein